MKAGSRGGRMSLEMTIVMLIAAWLAVAAAMLWGVMRISRRHHRSAAATPTPTPTPTPIEPQKHSKGRRHVPAH